MPLDPIKTTESITNKYISYLSTAFRLKNPELHQKFIEQLKPEKFVKGPILEATPPFKIGKSLNFCYIERTY